MTSQCICSGCQKLWRKMRVHSTCPTPERSTRNTPWCISRLEKNTFIRIDSQLGLQGANGWPLHDWIHQQGNSKVPTCYTSTSTASAIQIYPHPVWRQVPTRRRTRHLRSSHQRSNQKIPRHFWHTNLLWTSRWPNHIHRSQCNYIPLSQRHRSSPQFMSPTPWLNSNPS